MINDDKPMLRIREDGADACGTPWDGKHRLSRNASAPLRAIVKLERAEENRIEPMNRADAFQLLMTHGAVTRRGPMRLSGAVKLGPWRWTQRCWTRRTSTGWPAIWTRTPPASPGKAWENDRVFPGKTGLP